MLEVRYVRFADGLEAKRNLQAVILSKGSIQNRYVQFCTLPASYFLPIMFPLNSGSHHKIRVSSAPEYRAERVSLFAFISVSAMRPQKPAAKSWYFI